jgi:capsule polysaccharide export protein KpsE/RkpR
VSFYFYRVATPMYATHSEFIIQKAESGAGAGGGLGGLLGGSGFATVQESITVQAFLESREAMLRLDEELGFRAHFSQPEIDPLTRIADGATVEDMYSLPAQPQIGYDPTEGLVRMEVIAADPQVSAAFSEALIRYAEERVDQMSQRSRRPDGRRGESFEDAERRAFSRRRNACSTYRNNVAFCRPRRRCRPCSARSRTSSCSCRRNACALTSFCRSRGPTSPASTSPNATSRGSRP